MAPPNGTGPTGEGRLLLVSNRLPITIKRPEAGKFDVTMSSGGLVTGLSGLAKSTTFQWYGWPGLEIPENELPALKKRLREEYDAVPIMLDEELAERHYNGFSSESRALLSAPQGYSDLVQTRFCGRCFTTTPAK